MNVGVSKLDITPQSPVDLTGFRAREQPMTGVRDPLYARTLVFDNGKTRAALCVVDLLGVGRDVLDRIREQAGEAHDIAPENLHVAGTHTHCGPAAVRLRSVGEVDADYVGFLGERILQSIAVAANALRPARFLVARRNVNLAVDRRMQWAEVGDRGPQLDPELLALWIADPEKDEPFAVLVNYACHGVVMSDRRVSADWPGAACAAIEAVSGPDMTPLVLVGASGNLNPAERGAPEALRRAGRALAAATAEAPRAPLEADDMELLETRTRTYALRYQQWDEDRLIAFLDAEKEKLASGEIDYPDRRDWAQDRLAEFRRGEMPTSREIELNVLAVGPVRVALLPFETFTETGLAVKRAAPGRTLVAGCADGLYGYLPIESAYDEGGYEVVNAHIFYDHLPHEPGSAEEIAEIMAAMVAR